MLTLSEALKGNKLPEFIAQEEARGTGPIDRAEFDALAAKVIKVRQSEDQTSRSSCGDDLTGKQTRQGSGSYVAS